MFTEQDYSNAGALDQGLWDCIGREMSREEDVHAVQRLLTIGANPSHLNNYAVSLACEAGHASTLNMLLDHPDVDPREYDEEHGHPLLLASMNGHIRCVRVLLGHCRWDSDAMHAAIGCAEAGGNDMIVALLKRHL
ncbi:Hypothetical protein POVR2_LOCUS266 [uncultured virus]|nr:Hypothetical protein POVR2_LOCUS266 [uncultured virus]